MTYTIEEELKKEMLKDWLENYLEIWTPKKYCIKCKAQTPFIELGIENEDQEIFKFCSVCQKTQ